jgi:hypothetical protein
VHEAFFSVSRSKAAIASATSADCWSNGKLSEGVGVIKRAAKKFFASPLWQSLRLGRYLQLQSTLLFKYYGTTSSNVSTENRLDFAHYCYLTEQIRAQIDFPSSPFYAFLKYHPGFRSEAQRV